MVSSSIPRPSYEDTLEVQMTHRISFWAIIDLSLILLGLHFINLIIGGIK
jgi:hypothetical protein